MNDATDHLRHSVRRLQRLTVVLLCLVVILSAVTIAGLFADDEVVRARSVQIVSAEGDVLAELVAEDGNPGLYLRDRSGVNRVALLHDDDSTGLYLKDSDGITRIGVAQFAHGGGGVALHGPDSEGAAVLYLKEEGSLRFFDAEGNVTNQVPTREEK